MRYHQQRCLVLWYSSRLLCSNFHERADFFLRNDKMLQNITPAASSSFTLCHVSSLNEMAKRAFHFVDLWELLIEWCWSKSWLSPLITESHFLNKWSLHRPRWQTQGTHSNPGMHLQKPIHAVHLRMDLDNQWPHNWSTHLLLNIVGEVASF